MHTELVVARPPELDSRFTQDLRIRYQRVSDLKLDPQNPRKHGKKQIEQIAASIRAFGFVVPLLVDQDNRIIAGHGRVLAYHLLGRTEVPTICISHLTATERKAFVIADNRLTENAEWDLRLLGEALLDISVADVEVDLSVTGFDTGESDLLIQGLTLTDDAESEPEVLTPSGPAISQVGDVWLCDQHRVLCGDARDQAAYSIVMAGMRAGMILTDPPYNVPMAGHAGGLGRIQHREFAMASGEMTRLQFAQFLMAVFQHCGECSVDGSLHYLFMDWRHQLEILSAGEAVYSEKNVCIWDKGVGGMGSLYRSQHELVYVFKYGTASHRNNIELGRFGRNRTNVWRYPGANASSRSGEEGNLLADHPTPKPVALLADAMLDASARGDVILDPFLGSGSTLMAAERVGRRCYGIEIDPIYVDVAIRRWQRATGKSARHALTGERFDDCAQREEKAHGA